ncbi:hypothetical protein QWY31_16130 [Cytophagales bacterium LB-30]|uniref:GIY-YIG nuclease family protein n=1 Tax=Shiella aurantiaca TaxID=3058365 RepID=A0ABT8F9C1_9BACT|nr:hypothetical protein [Shiella aurantiaca]MDN4167040.1 hypothetical protein [Shiella aurantiaca]
MKEQIDIQLRAGLSNGIKQYEDIIDKSFDSQIIELDCKRLTNPGEKLPKEVQGYFFAPLHLIFPKDDKMINTRACLYVFEIVSPDPDEVYQAYSSYCKDPTAAYRNKSAFKEVDNPTSKILYIGKVKKNIGGRLATHMGYGPAKTGALQLAFWAQKISLQLKVHIYPFEPSLGDYINPLELSLSKALRPLIGKSK